MVGCRLVGATAVATNQLGFAPCKLSLQIGAPTGSTSQPAISAVFPDTVCTMALQRCLAVSEKTSLALVFRTNAPEISIVLVITAPFRRSRNFLSHHPQSKTCFERIVDAQPCVYQLLVMPQHGMFVGLSPLQYRYPLRTLTVCHAWPSRHS